MMLSAAVAALKSPNSTTSSNGEIEEINTKELAQRISAELKRYSIPQAIFAQRVLCRSQGTLSDLLRNPKPWSKLKSGRETFRRMWKWLQEPEFQRMSALRLAGRTVDNSHYLSYLTRFKHQKMHLFNNSNWILAKKCRSRIFVSATSRAGAGIPKCAPELWVF